MMAVSVIGWALVAVLGTWLYVQHGRIRMAVRLKNEWRDRYYNEEKIGHAAGWAAAREAAARIFETRASFQGGILASWRANPEQIPADLREEMIDAKALEVQSDINDARLIRSELKIPEAFDDAVRAAEEGLRSQWRAEVDFWRDNCKLGHKNYDRVEKELREAKREITALQGRSDET